MKKTDPCGAIIGVTQADGRVFAATTTTDPAILANTLDAHYATALSATMLVSLGETSRIGRTPRDCTITNGAEAVVVDATRFEAMDGACGNFHLFEHGAWSHWSIQHTASDVFAFEA